MPPLILDIKRLKARRTPIQLRGDWLAHTFGHFAEISELPAALSSQSATRELPSNLIAAWRNCIAAELLLRYNTGKPVPTEWIDTFGDATPFFNASTLHDLLHSPVACCMFPLASEKGKPGAGVAWVQRDHSPILVTDVERQDWIGDSWQLAAALARQALADGSPTIIQKLATDWIATGTCEGDRIGPVELSNKLDLDTRRHWILPAAITPPETMPRGQIFRAATAQGAFNIVTGQGYQRLEQQRIPCPIDVLHSFVSDARLPLLLAALATQPKTIRLWYSETFKTLTDEIRLHLIPAFLPDCILDEPQIISSSNLADIETTLRNALAKENAASQAIVFSVTNGNFIQRLAAASVASSFPQMQLVYRDFDTKGTNLTTISYQTFPPTTCYNASTSIDSTTVNIPVLTDRDDKKISTKELISKLQPEKDQDTALTSIMTRKQQP